MENANENTNGGEAPLVEAAGKGGQTKDARQTKDRRLFASAQAEANRVGGEVERIWYSQRDCVRNKHGDRVVAVFGWVSVFRGQSYGYRVVVRGD